MARIAPGHPQPERVFRCWRASSIEDKLASVVSVALSTLLSLLVVGAVLAMADLHHAALHVPLGLVGAALLFRIMPRSIGVPSTSGARWAVGMLFLICLAVGSLAASNAAELVVAGRDGATYANTAKFLVDGSGLFPDAVEPPFEDISGLEFQAPGFVVRDDGTFWQQFMHANAALFALWGELFGGEAIYLSNVPVSVVALLTLYVLGRRWLRPWGALLATACVGFCLPFLYYSAATFSELNMLALTAGGCWVLLNSQHRVNHVAGGALLGGAALVRVDGWLGGLAVALAGLWASLMGNKQEQRMAGGAWMGFFGIGLLAFVDLALYNRPYVVILGSRIHALILATVLLRLTGTLLARRNLSFDRLARGMARFGRPAFWVWAALGAYALLFRPLVEAPLGEPYGLNPIQAREGLAIEPRTYAEMSMRWLTWYLGYPMVILGWLTVGSLVRTVMTRSSLALRTAALTWILPALVYLWRPSVNPDHIWAMRRFLPVVIPGLCIAATVGVSNIVSKRSGGRSLTVLLSVILAGPVLLASIPLMSESDTPDLDGWIVELCGELDGYDGVLLVDSDPEARLVWRLGPPLRAWCGQSVAGVESHALDRVLGQLPDPRQVAVVSETPLDLPDRDARALPPLRAQAWITTLSHRPRATERVELDLVVHE